MLNLKQPTLSSEATVEETNDGDLDDCIPNLWQTNPQQKIMENKQICENLSGFCCSKSFWENYENKDPWIPNLVFIRRKHGNDKRVKEEFPEPGGAEETT